MFQKTAALACFIALIALLAPQNAMAQAIPLNFVKQWEAMPDESLFSLISRDNIHIVGSDVARLDPPMAVNVVYLEYRGSPKQLYRCVEYVREFQFETMKTDCYVAVTPVNLRK